MCGIFGCVLKEGTAAPLIHASLKTLEYRGYDSVGIATISNDKIWLKKDQGKIDDVHRTLNLDDLPGNIGIGHTRWATHGAPLKVNAHPHSDCTGQIVVVHNGIIENFSELKLELENNGHNFVSKTDTEVIAHLIEANLKRHPLSLADAVLETVKSLEGSFAIAVLSTREPDKVICARNESPLVLGVSENGVYCASDIPAFLPVTNKAVMINNGELIILSQTGYEIRKINDSSIVVREPEIIDWTPEMAVKQGYPHFMIKEIHEQPATLRNTLRMQEHYLDLISTFLDRANEVFLVACGTSYHACLAASYMFSKLAFLPTYPVYASVYIGQQSGPEIGVAATKTFTSQLSVLAQLALRLSKKRGKISQDEMDDLEERLEHLPDIVDTIVQTQEEKVKHLAEKYKDSRVFFFLGRGISTATAFEGRLKLMEIAYIPSIAFPAGESKHGPISLVEEGFPVIFLCPKDDSHKTLIGNIMEMKARGASIIAIVEEGDDEIKALSDDFIEVPKGIPEVISPIPFAVPLQLLAYYMALEKGHNPDTPRNLAKSVTVK
jgi:glucosamine--fructose-6-phosphate aminotransferase (isomerizing)